MKFVTHGWLSAALLLAVSQLSCADECVNPALCETPDIVFESDDADRLSEKAAELGSAVKIYEYLRNTSQYTPYHGSRSNSVNTFLALRGNDVDLASTFIAMLRSQGIQARYAVGTIRVARNVLANWLGVIDTTLAPALLIDQGIQAVDTSDPDTVAFEHVWVEALLDFANYRGEQSTSLATCAVVNDSCQWVPLDVSFKQKTFSGSIRTLLSGFSFDYEPYYNAQNPSAVDYPKNRNKSPLEMFEEQAREYLRAEHPGVTLEDIADRGAIIRDESGLLPGSLPYEVMGEVARYNSGGEHDAENVVNWRKSLHISWVLDGCRNTNFENILKYSIGLNELSTKQFTLTVFAQGANKVLGYRVDGQPVGTTISVESITVDCSGGGSVAVGEGTPIDVKLEIDAEPGVDPVTVLYEGLTVGGYYLIAAGGESSNRSQVTRAYEDLLAANEQYPVVVDPEGTVGTPGTAYVDINANGVADTADTPLIESVAAQDALTGGLLYVAQALYYTRLREDSERYGALTGVISPVSVYAGIVSADNTVEYLDDLPFAIMPGGLLIDLKGIRLNGSWKIDEPESRSDEAFLFLGHLGSSLEHEVWQQITGYDAISTMRGFQFALEQGGELLQIRNHGSTNNFPDAVVNMGFTHAAPAGFSNPPFSYSLFDKSITSWSYSGSDTEAAFEVFRPDTTGYDPASDIQTFLVKWDGSNNNLNDTLSSYDTFENQYTALIPTENQLKTGLVLSSAASQYATYDVISATSTTPGFSVSSYSRPSGTSNQYDYLINETNQHNDGIYEVQLSVRLADNVNEISGLTANGITGTVQSVQVTSPAGITVKNYSHQGSVVTTTVQKNGSMANGTYDVSIQYQWIVNGVPQQGTATFDTNINVFDNKFVDLIANIVKQPGFDVSDNLPALICGGNTYQSAPPSTLIGHLENCYNSWVATNGLEELFSFFDQDNDFDPASYAYRPTEIDSDIPKNFGEHDNHFVREIRSHMYHVVGDGRYEYSLPSRLPQDTYYLFNVFAKHTYDGDDNLVGSTYGIINRTGWLFSGGGYVAAEGALDPTDPVQTEFSNRLFNDLNTVSISNNDLIKTPSTSDPISTVTGNMYHDETDISIRGRGLPYLLTRTYNSNKPSVSSDGPFGYGWTHSYNMRLRSNDYGECPNCTAGTGPGQSPINGNSKTSSITYTDERGGDHNYLVNETSYGVTAPEGEFDTLELDHPVLGQHTLTFRNGVRYVFENIGGGNIKASPDVQARLKQISEPYGSQLNFTYDGSGRLTAVADNLGISGRSGLTFNYNGSDIHVDDVADWTGRTWHFEYNSDGNLESVTNPLDETSTYSYHPGNEPAQRHYLSKRTKPEARGGKAVETIFEYYEDGRAYLNQDSLKHGESVTYDLFRKKTAVTDPRGHVTVHQYDPNTGGLLKLTHPNGSVQDFENTTEGLRFSKTDGLGYQTHYSYASNFGFGTATDTGGQVTRERDALGQDVNFTYGPFDQPASITDKKGTTITWSFYDVAGTCAAVGKPKERRISVLGTDSNVLLEEFCWNPNGTLSGRTEYIDPAAPARKRVTTYTYEPGSADLNVYEIVVSGSGKTIRTQFAYDALGRKLSETLFRVTSASDPTEVGITTAYTYDALDRVTKVKNPRGDIAETVFDANGQVYRQMTHYKTAAARDHCSPSTISGFAYRTCIEATHSYDPADRRVSSTDILGNSTAFSYDEIGNLILQVDALGHETRYEYDTINRRTAVIDANGHRSKVVYDIGGRLTNSIDANGNQTTYEYDALGRRIKIVTALGKETRFEYDANGNQIKIRDANGIAGTQPYNAYGASEYREYDEMNRLERIVDAQDHETIYGYDLLGNITDITDAEGQHTRMVYDDLGRLSQIIDPVIDSPDINVTMTYDQAGNVLTRTDRKAQVTVHAYDRLNRRIQTNFLTDATQESMVYDDFGDLVTVSNSAVTYTYAYDTLHRLIEKIDNRGNRSLAWSYDVVGNVLTKTDYQGDITHYQYDSTDRLVSEQNNAYLQVSYHYDPGGRLMNRILSNGVQTDYQYDADNRLTSLFNRTATGTIIHQQTYSHDHVGNITGGLMDVDGDGDGDPVVYLYDPVYRLLSADYPGTALDETYTYDGAGNRMTFVRDGTALHYIYGAGNRLHEIRQGSSSGALLYSYRYDRNGNRKEYWEGAVTTGTLLHSYTYDQKNRINSIVVNGVPGSLDFAYDPFNYRIQKQSASETNKFYLEGEHLEAIYDNTGNVRAKYLRGVVVDEIVNGYINIGSGGVVSLNYHHDHLRSVTGVSTHDGEIAEQLQYSPFGGILSRNGNSPSDIEYTGRQFDDETDLHYYRARYYEAKVGRFLSEDPVGFSAGINFYSYAQNNPISNSDPSGMFNVTYTAGNPIPTITSLPVATPAYYISSGASTYPIADNDNIADNGIRVPLAGFSGVRDGGQTASWISTQVQRNVSVGSVGAYTDLYDMSAEKGFWDTKHLLDRNGLYVVNGVAQYNDYVGNVVWGATMNEFNYPEALALAGAQAYAMRKGELDDSRDQAGISAGYGFNLNWSPLNHNAGGGFVLYPNKANNNMSNRVYAK